MALEKPALTYPWDNPVWPDRLPESGVLQLLYESFADEMVVRFDDRRHRGEIVVPISTPQEDYAGMLVDGESGDVVGVHIYPLAAYALERHPAWQPATQPNPDPSVAARIVRDIKNLFDRYGIETGGESD